MEAPYGSWPSPLAPAAAAAGAVRFGALCLGPPGADGVPAVWWTETRPDEGGRAVVVCHAGGVRRDVGGPGASARSGVNEYGGGALWLDDAGRPWWVDAATQQVLRGAADPDDADTPAEPLTALPPVLRAARHAAGVVAPGGGWAVVERELHVDVDGAPLDEPVNELAVVRTDGGDVTTLMRDGDFAAAPALSSDGAALAWLRWDHPDLPWDAAELWCAAIEVDPSGAVGLVAPRRVAGGHRPGAPDGDGGWRAVSVCLPVWSPDGRLWWCDDRDDLWQLRRAPSPGVPAAGAGDGLAPAVDTPGEAGEPRWVAGGRRCGFTGDGAVVHVATADGVDAVWVVAADGVRSPLPGPGFDHVELLAVSGRHVAVVGGATDRPTSVWLVDLDTGVAQDLAPRPAWLAAQHVSVPRHVTVPTDDGEVTHALVYPPQLDGTVGPPDARPPLVLRVHGGPTAAARAECSPSVQFWTTRGVAVAEVNHRGSTGYGRRYRDRLRGGWGVVDVADCLAVARHLAEVGEVDPGRCVIRGGSSGGFTTLAALCADDDGVLAGGCSAYGVTDLVGLAASMHKFESRYFDALVGPLPAAADTYAERSPLSHPERLRSPVLLLQGGVDPVVPLEQAVVLADALADAGVPHALVVFPDEAHGFRAASTLTTALGLELAFAASVLGFTPADDDLPRLELTPG